MVARILVTLAACVLMSLEAPPVNLHWIQWFGLVPMFWVLREDAPRSNRWLGYLYGVVGVAAIFRWLVSTIDLFSNLPLALALGVLLLFSAGFGAPYALLWGSVHPLRKRIGSWWILAWPALWVLCEYVCLKLFLFPYNHGVGQYQVALTWQVVGITGVWGLTYLIFFGNAVLGEWLMRWRESNPEPPGFFALAFALSVAGVVGYGSYRFEFVESELRTAPVVKTAQLQSDVTMMERLEMSPSAAMREWYEASAKIPRDTIDLVVWPEGATAFLTDRMLRSGRLIENPDRLKIAKLADERNFGMVVGSGRIVFPEGGEFEVYNTAYFFDGDGNVVDTYDKLVPIPFGEYMPLGETFPWLAKAIGGIGNFRAGTDPKVVDVGDLSIATPICYEAILPDTCRKYENPGLFVNITNDAWFGESAAPFQHGMLAAARSTELGVPMVRSTYTGTSFVVEPHGVLHSQTGLFERVARRVHVRYAAFPTFYSRFGDWFVGLCALLLVGLWFGARSVSEGAGDT